MAEHPSMPEGTDNGTRSDEVRLLLIGYSHALDTAAALPPMLRIASRPGRWTLFEPLRRLPRSTIGTHSIAVYHARRSTAELERRYARIAATRGLTDDEQRASQLVKSFHLSLSELRWKLIIAGGLIGVFVTVQVIVGGVSNLLTRAARTPGQDPASERVRALAESLIRAGSGAPSASSFIDLFGQFGKAGLAELLALAATLIAAAYVVVRPLSPAFRIKRLIFNLAATCPGDMRRTTTTWNVPRSVGLYQLERDVFSHLGGRAPREIDLDLWISAVPPAGMILLLSTGDFDDAVHDLSLLLFLVLCCALPVAARIVWLANTYRARRRTSRPVDPPAGLRISAAGDIVEVRSVVETAGLGVVTNYLLCSGFLVPSPIWIRLVRERRDLEMAKRPDGAAPQRRSSLPWPAVGSAMLMWLLPVIPVYIHLTRLIRLQPKGIGTARRTRAWLVPLAAAATSVAIYDVGFRLSVETWTPWFLYVSSVVGTIAFTAVQYEHNALFAHIGTPLPFDDPMPVAEASCRPVPLPALPTAAYTSWLRRLLALLVDVIPLALIAAIGIGFAWATGAPTCMPDNGTGEACVFTVSPAGTTALLIGAVLVLTFAICNWGYRQGTTGASVGKSLLKLEVISEKTGQPVGFEWSVVRQIAHLVDCATFGIGWLFPLWDDKRQTFADKLMSTVCLPTQPSTASAPVPDIHDASSVPAA